jgi:peptide chain release factor subunit 1
MSLSEVAQQIDRLSRITPDRHPVVSCYLKLEPSDRSRGKYLIKLKNRVKAVEERLPSLGFDRAGQNAARADLARIVEDLSRPGSLPSTRGIAIFASSGLRLYERVAVPLVYRSLLAVDRTPLVRQLLAAEDEVGRLLTVVLDRQSARVFEVTAFGAAEIADLRAEATRGGRFHSDRRDAPGAGEHTYHNRLRTEKQRHLDRVAATLFALDRKQAVHGLVLAGIGTDADALRPFLHPYLRDRVLGVVKLNPKETTPAHVHTATLEARAKAEAAQEARLVEQVQEAAGTGWAVTGVRDTLRALHRGQVRQLLVSADAEAAGFRSGATGRLALTERELRSDGEVVPVFDVIDEAVEEALRQGLPVEVIHSPAAAARIHALAGLLRFRA